MGYTAVRIAYYIASRTAKRSDGRSVYWLPQLALKFPPAIRLMASRYLFDTEK
jgi:hypothetical protein